MDSNEALDILKHGDAGSRKLAARELRRWDHATVKQALASALGDAERDVRQAAARSLMEIGDASVVPMLIPFLRSGTPELRNGAREVLEKVCRIEPTALIDLAADPDPRMRVFAANIMGGTGDHDFVPPLLKMLRDGEANVVEAALAALGQLGSRDAVASLRDFAVHADAWLRFSAVDALGRIADASAAAALLELLPDAEPDFLEPVIDALGRQGASASVLPLVGLLDSRPELQPALLRTLLGPLAPQVATFGRHPRLQPLARAAAEALGRNELPARLASTTTVLLAGIGNGLSGGERQGR